MDELGGFEPTDTTGFIAIESIRIKKYVLGLLCGVRGLFAKLCCCVQVGAGEHSQGSRVGCG